MTKDAQVDFFISYNQADCLWARGIGDWLDQAIYSTVMQSQDFVAGSNFVSEMNAALSQAKCVIAVVSPDYFDAPFPESEWTAAFVRDPTGSDRSLILVRVRECDIPPLLAPRVYIDLVGLDHNAARDHFLSEIKATLAGKRTSGGKSPKRESGRSRSRGRRSLIHQEIHGDRNTQSINVFNELPKVKEVLERREGSITPAECRQVQAWVEELAEGSIGMSRPQAYSKWWGHFKSAFGLAKYEDLLSAEMPKAKRWFEIQRGKQTRGLKSNAPDQWRNKRIGAIKAAMKSMGAMNAEYYPHVAQRLKMKKPFTSLKKLTKRDLDRVYSMALRDVRGA